MWKSIKKGILKNRKGFSTPDFLIIYRGFKAWLFSESDRVLRIFFEKIFCLRKFKRDFKASRILKDGFLRIGKFSKGPAF